MSFYNTTNEEGEELRRLQINADSQEGQVAAFFLAHKEREYTPFEVLDSLGVQWPITSIRRAMTNLTAKGLLIKTETKKVADYGHNNYCWKYLSRTDERQRSLFEVAI